jgi:hypothetical protein
MLPGEIIDDFHVIFSKHACPNPMRGYSNISARKNTFKGKFGFSMSHENVGFADLTDKRRTLCASNKPSRSQTLQASLPLTSTSLLMKSPSHQRSTQIHTAALSAHAIPEHPFEDQKIPQLLPCAYSSEETHSQGLALMHVRSLAMHATMSSVSVRSSYFAAVKLLASVSRERYSRIQNFGSSYNLGELQNVLLLYMAQHRVIRMNARWFSCGCAVKQCIRVASLQMKLTAPFFLGSKTPGFSCVQRVVPALFWVTLKPFSCIL